MKSFIPALWIILSLTGCRTSQEPQDAFSFGLIADIQYADKEPGGTRHYRSSLERLKLCVTELNRHDLAFTIQLGDIIDGNETPETTLTDLDAILAIYSTLNKPAYHVVGNHCLAADRAILLQRLQLERAYYEFTRPEAEGWRFIVLDGNDAGYGALGELQLEWLRGRLAEARAKDEKVIVFNHFPLLEGAAASHRMREPESVLELINDSGCVVAYFAGHDHAGGYAYQDGIHHVTFRGMVEAPEANAHAIVKVRPGKLEETGYGNEPSRELRIGVALSGDSLPDSIP